VPAAGGGKTAAKKSAAFMSRLVLRDDPSQRSSITKQNSRHYRQACSRPHLTRPGKPGGQGGPSHGCARFGMARDKPAHDPGNCRDQPPPGAPGSLDFCIASGIQPPRRRVRPGEGRVSKRNLRRIR
jgi:hypothetical protein